jgi:hypothetical protein
MHLNQRNQRFQESGIKNQKNAPESKESTISRIRNQESENTPKSKESMISRIRNQKNALESKESTISRIKNQESEKMHLNGGHQKGYGKILLMSLIKKLLGSIGFLKMML